jgi:hypothetical protein
MKTVHSFTIKTSLYHAQMIGRIVADGEESALYSLPELANIIKLMKMGGLMGSFFIGKVLAHNADMGIE